MADQRADQRAASAEWMRLSTAPLVALRTLRFGSFWWSIEYPFAGRTVRASFAGGNDGQLLMRILVLNLVVLFYVGNYRDPVMHLLQERLVPEQQLSALVRPWRGVARSPIGRDVITPAAREASECLE